MRVVCDHDWDDLDAGLDGEMESALLEWEEVGRGEVGACAFGEDPDALLVVADLADGAVECGNGRLAVRTVDEDGAAQSHCPLSLVRYKGGTRKGATY